jgi:hypothetical protein
MWALWLGHVIFTSTSYMYLTWMYLLILFMWQYRYMILLKSEYVWSSCYTCTICNVHHRPLVFLAGLLLVKEYATCVVSHWIWDIGDKPEHDPLNNNNYIYIFRNIKTLKYAFVLTLFSIQYYIYFFILFLFCFYKANNFSGDGVSHFPTSSAVALWPFLVATPFV